MKELKKKIIATLLVVGMAFSMFYGMFNKSYAYIVEEKDATEYQFNPKDVLWWSANEGAGQDNNVFPFITVKPTADQFKGDVPNGVYPDYIELNLNEDYNDNTFNAVDSSYIFGMCLGQSDSLKIVDQLSQDLGIAASEITLNIYIELREDNKTIQWTIKNGKCQQSDEQIEEDLDTMYEYCKKCYISQKYTHKGNIEGGTADDWQSKYDDAYLSAMDDVTDSNRTDAEKEAYADEEAKDIMLTTYPFYILEADAVLPNGTKYCLVIGGEGDYNQNWLLAKKELFVKDYDPVEEFSTTLDYTAVIDGKVVKEATSEKEDPFLPPYFDDDNNKKDSDAIAYIRSQTDETIKTTNGVDMKDDGTANSEGWYYPDTNNKTVIAKTYPFDSYDNTTYNGMVTETVKITGSNGGTSDEKPNIKWTFRRKDIDTTTDSNYNTTVVITYNLPVDESSIPDGWKPIYDSDGKTIHKITRTFGPDETYNKDVTVKQNGTDATNTAHITIEPRALAKTGEIVPVALAVIAIVAVVMYFKSKKYKKIK